MWSVGKKSECGDVLGLIENIRFSSSNRINRADNNRFYVIHFIYRQRTGNVVKRFRLKLKY